MFTPSNANWTRRKRCALVSASFASPTPTALHHSAQGCESASYPGNASQNCFQPQRGCIVSLPPVLQPLQGCPRFSTLPQGSSSLATLGWMMEPRWGSPNARRAPARGLQPASGSTGHRPVAPGNLPGATAARSQTHHAASKIPCAFRTGSATVPVAPVGVPPTGWGARQVERAVTFVRRAKFFGGTPKTAGETPALPPTPTAEILRKWNEHFSN